MGSDELVILVHGTFAGDKDQRDEGPRWWQRDSACWKALAAVLPKGAALPEPGEEIGLFHWSGINAQSKRLKAGAELLDLLLKLEERERKYHLVGHSHGGSVIWETLVSAQIIAEGSWIPYSLTHRRGRQQVRVDARLTGLRSVTTVGTPFLHFLPRPTRLVLGWRHPQYTLSGDDVQTTPGKAMFVLPLLLLHMISFLGFFLGGPALALLVLITLRGIHPPTVWLLVLWGLLGLAVLGMLMAGPANQVMFTDGLTHRARASRKVFERFADRWLGLWATDDEAIGVLKGVAPRAPSYAWLWRRPQERKSWEPTRANVPAQRIPVRIGNPISVAGMIPDASLWKLTHVVKSPLGSAFNRWIGPRLSAWISRTLLHAVQGNDLPQTSLVYAAAWPLPLDRLPPGLPELLAARLTERADSRSAQLAPAIRQMLARAALDGVPLPQAAAAGQRPRADGALVHTSYFDDPELLRLIALHIERHLAEPPVKPPEKLAEERALRDWLDENAEAVRQRLAEFHSEVSGDDNQPQPAATSDDEQLQSAATSDYWHDFYWPPML
ncbi:hypothetical protein [Streptomyces sp. NPDC001678]|uniref:hypothetical protein n=1 Tax=Streptomyces sp. NPDC001678 TaxID=3364599 RepID=UPI0036BA5F02